MVHVWQIWAWKGLSFFSFAPLFFSCFPSLFPSRIIHTRVGSDSNDTSRLTELGDYYFFIFRQRDRVDFRICIVTSLIKEFFIIFFSFSRFPHVAPVNPQGEVFGHGIFVYFVN
ncbi:hypothetical protein K449DRAFT_200128 [Hypoxylon sp. EC38]|nr:hypothetical protein K449DRAFT_200128 [Hypoxylon sp. EC38]